MPSSKLIERLVVDANPLIAVLQGGAALRAFTSGRVSEFAVAAFTLEEVQEFIPELATDLDEDEETLYTTLALLPLTTYPQNFYKDKISEAEKRIAHRDPDDVDALALALKLDCPVWSNDADFSEARIAWYTTARLLKTLQQ